jgi:hypothetical protein
MQRLQAMFAVVAAHCWLLSLVFASIPVLPRPLVLVVLPQVQSFAYHVHALPDDATRSVPIWIVMHRTATFMQSPRCCLPGTTVFVSQIRRFSLLLCTSFSAAGYNKCVRRYVHHT